MSMFTVSKVSEVSKGYSILQAFLVFTFKKWFGFIKVYVLTGALNNQKPYCLVNLWLVFS